MEDIELGDAPLAELSASQANIIPTSHQKRKAEDDFAPDKLFNSTPFDQLFANDQEAFTAPFRAFKEQYETAQEKLAATLQYIPTKTDWVHRMLPRYEKLRGQTVILVLGMCRYKDKHDCMSDSTLTDEMPFTTKIVLALQEAVKKPILFIDLRKECRRLTGDKGCFEIRVPELHRLCWATKLELLIAQECYEITFEFVWSFSECWRLASGIVFNTKLPCLKDSIPKRHLDWHISKVANLQVCSTSSARKALVLDILESFFDSNTMAREAYPTIRQFLKIHHSRFELPELETPAREFDEILDEFSCTMSELLLEPQNESLKPQNELRTLIRKPLALKNELLAHKHKLSEPQQKPLQQEPLQQKPFQQKPLALSEKTFVFKNKLLEPQKVQRSQFEAQKPRIDMSDINLETPDMHLPATPQKHREYIKCDKCGSTFCNTENLNIHQAQCSQIQERRAAVKEAESIARKSERWPCERCGGFLSSRWSLEDHKKICKGKKRKSRINREMSGL